MEGHIAGKPLPPPNRIRGRQREGRIDRNIGAHRQAGTALKNDIARIARQGDVVAKIHKPRPAVVIIRQQFDSQIAGRAANGDSTVQHDVIGGLQAQHHAGGIRRRVLGLGDVRRHGDVAGRLACSGWGWNCHGGSGGDGHTGARIQCAVDVTVKNLGVVRSRSENIGILPVESAASGRALRANRYIIRIQQPLPRQPLWGRGLSLPKRLEIIFRGSFDKASVAPLRPSQSSNLSKEPRILVRPENHLSPIPIFFRIGRDFSIR